MRSPTIRRPGGSEAGQRPAFAGLGLIGLSLAAGAAFAAAGAAQALDVRLVNDQASVRHRPAAPARQTPVFSLGRRGPGGAWGKVQPLETSFCLTPCPVGGGLPAERDCGRPPRTRIAVPAG